MNDFINYLIFFSGTAVGGVAVYFFRTLFEHELAISRSIETIKITEFNKASATFRATFVNEQYLLRQNIISGQEMVHHIITPEILTNHEKAKILFEPFLLSTGLEGFNSAWEKYKDYENNYYMEFLNTSQSISKRPEFNPAKQESKKDFSQYCLTHIDNLLKYAKPKI